MNMKFSFLISNEVNLFQHTLESGTGLKTDKRYVLLSAYLYSCLDIRVDPVCGRITADMICKIYHSLIFR